MSKFDKDILLNSLKSTPNGLEMELNITKLIDTLQKAVPEMTREQIKAQLIENLRLQGIEVDE